MISHGTDKFLPFGLLPMWRRLEIEEFRRNLTTGSLVTYLDAGGVASLYPGVRCDGMHFQSNYIEEYACYGSPAVWDVYLLQLLEHIGLLQRCTPTLWAQQCKRQALAAPKSPGHQHWVSTSLGRHADAAATRILPAHKPCYW